MRRNGGTEAFGPDAVKAQMSKLRRLSLHTSHRKLLSAAAFQAMREVLGELVGADSIDSRIVPLIAVRSGGYSRIVRTSSPTARPIGIASVNLPEVFGSHDDRQWVEAVDGDLVRPQVDGFCVMAATATHERSFRDESWLTEQYFGPSIDVDSPSLFEHVQHFPKLILTDRIELRYQTPSSGAVAHPEPIMAGSIDMNELMMCPIVAAKLGWRPDPNHALTFGNGNGEPVAYTSYWRDGGIASRESNTSIRRYGCAVLVRADHFLQLGPYLAKDYEVRAWRQFQKSVNDNCIIRTARRVEPPPFVLSRRKQLIACGFTAERSAIMNWNRHWNLSIGGRAGSQTRICSFGRCRVVRYTTHPSGTRAGNPTRISSLGPKRHHALDHASLLNVEGMQRIEL